MRWEEPRLINSSHHFVTQEDEDKVLGDGVEGEGGEEKGPDILTPQPIPAFCSRYIVYAVYYRYIYRVHSEAFPACTV